jgi:hypothetical protein
VAVRDKYQGYPPWPYGGCALHGELGRQSNSHVPETPAPPPRRSPLPPPLSSTPFPHPSSAFLPQLRRSAVQLTPLAVPGVQLAVPKKHHVYVALGGTCKHWMMGLPHVALAEARRDGSPQQGQHVVREKAHDFLLRPVVNASVVSARKDGAAAVLARRLQHRLPQGGVMTKHVEHDPVLGHEEDPGRR